LEVKKAKDIASDLEKRLENKITSHSASLGLWNEFNPELVAISQVLTTHKKIAGVSIPVMKEIVFDETEYSLFSKPKWFPDGVSLLKELTGLVIEKEISIRTMKLLEHARRKTTQKVNLYEKVQIPGYEDAIRKIKRFLEDEENLSKSAQKIVKKRQQKQKETAA